MDTALKQAFIERWAKYFPGEELPITFFYSNDPASGESVPSPKGHRCVVSLLTLARRGRDICLDVEAVGCSGGKRYFGFTSDLMPNFEYFLSCGIPGQLEGERYKKSPEMVRALMANAATFTAPAPYIVFKRWDRVAESDEPVAVIFFVRPDVLSGLFTLAGFDEVNPNAVAAPFGAGCGTIVQYPYLERDAECPRAFIGMFDVSARPCVSADILSFATPMKKFVRMIANMDESFLITESWQRVRERIAKSR
ncbi:MAG TPA: DUF169 domain-containing protein [Candidatus Hydrogenedentes bacterium]|nr:DUF169 domain-containing protein [Candidatus Hydrogenedentota bacterium]HPG66397.1 DUF169 domain-containing protein [Candidatus Hydrogenedentota bacterium]